MFQSCLGFAQGMEGSWKGLLSIQGATLPIVFHIKKNDMGEWSGEMQRARQPTSKLIFDKVLVQHDSLYVRASAIEFFFRGKLAAGKLRGVVQQQNKRLPLVLEPFEPAIQRRPQLPQPPYPYDTLDVSFGNGFDAVQLAGTLSFPKAHGKHPAVVLITGSGPQDRNETMEGHQPFKLIADYLTKKGVVVLRYDERGVGKSTGNYVQSTIGDFSRDALGALSFVKKQKQVDSSRVGIIGHSEGGLIAALLAGQRAENIDFIALLAPPAIPIDSLMLLQAYELGRIQGMNDKQLEQAKAINRRNFAIVKGQLSDQQAYTEIIANVSLILGHLTASQEDEFKMMLLPSYRYFMRIDPVPFIEKIDVPVFAAFGTKDLQVPFAPNLESLTDHLPNRKDHFLKAYEGLNHLFQQAKTGSPQEYAEIEETFNEQVLHDLSDWINER
ncbi:alpha/beta hydrolase [Sphingobacterium griseoflavum]|uniref:Alpha/beta hydrolase n=2 Tax=Sphingobacterium griseoflavum TaxID=1474952 RepID=A0ABQ3HYF8_9SPHI|nr:alpha/beta hydrolase [Sphingobacterium griseoflavum]